MPEPGAEAPDLYLMFQIMPQSCHMVERESARCFILDIGDTIRLLLSEHLRIGNGERLISGKMTQHRAGLEWDAVCSEHELHSKARQAVQQSGCELAFKHKQSSRKQMLQPQGLQSMLRPTGACMPGNTSMIPLSKEAAQVVQHQAACNRAGVCKRLVSLCGATQCTC